jgi:hypothetical protein
VTERIGERTTIEVLRRADKLTLTIIPEETTARTH